MFISSPFDDIFAVQEDQELDVILYDRVYKYIDFSTNLEQSPKNQKYENLYNFSDIDTAQNTEIIINVAEKLERNNFTFDFKYDSQYYSPSFYISENDAQSYSQVLKSDISDFAPTDIKIVFQAIGEENIREIIQIQTLSIRRNTYIWEIIPNNVWETIKVYGSNSCGQTRDNIVVWNTRPTENFISPIFIENPLYNANNTDTDWDGVSDLDDNCASVSNRNQEDINSNGIWDACEFDSDSDSVPDSIDNCRNTPNPLQLDDDGDKIWNSCDNCNLYNPDQRDENNDWVGDVCESQANYLSDNDDDSDWIINFSDNCRYIANPDQADSDSDGVWNICDNCQTYKNPNQEDKNNNGIWDICEDSDVDGIDGLRDNCPNVPNQDQADSDNDGIGNVCEDDDNDSIIFIDDNCPYKFNPDQKDTDRDSLWDVCDESDDRVLESNRTVFIILMLLVIAGFCVWIYWVMRKLEK